MALTDNIVAYYKLDEDAGVTLVDAVATQNLTASSTSILNASGFLNRCIFPNKLYTAAALPALTTAGSISFWFKNNDKTAVDNAIAGRQESGLTNFEWLISIILTTGKMNFWIESSGGQVAIISNADVSDNSWKHCVLTWSYGNANDMKMYIDGVLQTATATSGNAPSAATPKLGGVLRGGVGTWDFTGYIDEFAIWSRVLTLPEVQALYNSGLGFTYPFVVPSAPVAATPTGYANIDWLMGQKRRDEDAKKHEIQKKPSEDDWKHENLIITKESIF